MTVCILNTSDIFKAQLAKSKLESNGIMCELRTHDASGTLPHLRSAEGTELFVAKEDEKRARSTLKNLVLS